MKALKHTGNSANIAFYTEQTARREFPTHMVEVLRDDIMWVFNAQGERTRATRRVPVFSVTVRRWLEANKGNTEVARFTYEPKTKPATYNLSVRTVARLIKERGL